MATCTTPPRSLAGMKRLKSSPVAIGTTSASSPPSTPITMIVHDVAAAAAQTEAQQIADAERAGRETAGTASRRRRDSDAADLRGDRSSGSPSSGRRAGTPWPTSAAGRPARRLPASKPSSGPLAERHQSPSSVTWRRRKCEARAIAASRRGRPPARPAAPRRRRRGRRPRVGRRQAAGRQQRRGRPRGQPGRAVLEEAEQVAQAVIEDRIVGGQPGPRRGRRGPRSCSPVGTPVQRGRRGGTGHRAPPRGAAGGRRRDPARADRPEPRRRRERERSRCRHRSRRHRRRAVAWRRCDARPEQIDTGLVRRAVNGVDGRSGETSTTSRGRLRRSPTTASRTQPATRRSSSSSRRSSNVPGRPTARSATLASPTDHAEQGVARIRPGTTILAATDRHPALDRDGEHVRRTRLTDPGGGRIVEHNRPVAGQLDAVLTPVGSPVTPIVAESGTARSCRGDQVGVQPALADQLVVRAALHDPPVRGRRSRRSRGSCSGGGRRSGTCSRAAGGDRR